MILQTTQWVQDLTEKRNIMTPFGIIVASQQATRGRYHHCDVIRDVKREIHHADDVKRDIWLNPSRMLVNQMRETALSVG